MNPHVSQRTTRSRQWDYEVEIPDVPMLTQGEERSLGTEIQAQLERVRRWLPRHPHGYQRLLATVANPSRSEVRAGEGRDFRKDYLLGAARWDLAVTTASSDAERARQFYLAGADLLRTTPLGPEQLLAWAGEAGDVSEPSEVSEIIATERIARILRRAAIKIRKSRDALVLRNMRLVIHALKRLDVKGQRQSDLFQEGVIALQKAALRFDPTVNVRFVTYATYWVRQSIRKAMLDKSQVIRVPQAVQAQFFKFNAGRATAMDPVEAERVRKIMRETVSANPTDDSRVERTGAPIAAIEASELPASTEESLHLHSIPSAVRNALRRLDDRQRTVLSRRFGLQDGLCLSLEQIGQHMRLSRERVRQILNDALARLKRVAALEEVYGDLLRTEKPSAARPGRLARTTTRRFRPRAVEPCSESPTCQAV